jgi:hypothetical protein
MRVVGEYSFKNGKNEIRRHFPDELAEVYEIIDSIEASRHKTKISLEKTMPGRVLFSPASLNKDFKQAFHLKDWRAHKQACAYPLEYYQAGYRPKAQKGAFREMDFVKNRLGVEVQFGKYAFMVYNVCAKMTIFRNLGIIDMGIEIVPIKELAEEMSTGVSYFEQFVWDLEHRGVADIDIPVLVLGVTS